MATLSQSILKRAALIHDRFFCENCGSTANLRPYHRDGDLRNHSLRNIGALCPSCHSNRDRFLVAKWRACRQEDREVTPAVLQVG